MPPKDCAGSGASVDVGRALGPGEPQQFQNPAASMASMGYQCYFQSERKGRANTCVEHVLMLPGLEDQLLYAALHVAFC